MKVRSRIAAVGLAFAAALQVSPFASAQELRSADNHKADHLTVKAVEKMDEVLRARTDGRLWVGDTGAGSTASETFLVAQVRMGTLDMARISLNALNENVPVTTVPTLPFLFSSRESARRALDGELGQEIAASLERAGLVTLAFFDGVEKSFYGRSGFVRTPADLRGKRVRVQRGDSSNELLRALGAEPVTIPSWQTLSALQSGAVDLAEGDASDYFGSGHYKVARYFSETRHMRVPSVLVFSLRTWLSLREADRAVLREAARAGAAEYNAQLDAFEAAAKAQAMAGGAEFAKDINRIALRNAMVPLYPRALRGEGQDALVGRISAQQDQEAAMATR